MEEKMKEIIDRFRMENGIDFDDDIPDEKADEENITDWRTEDEQTS